MPQPDPRDFWEAKILPWEQGRYDQSPATSWLERVADRASRSLRFRLHSAGELLAPHVQGKRILDLGCGTGRLGPALLQAGASHYIGIDIAPTAIRAAQERAEREGWAHQATFVTGDLDTLAEHPADVIVSLGLTDWLTDNQLSRLWQLGGDAAYLHAISERRPSPAQLAHRLYVWLAYGHRTGSYIPRYFRVADLAALAAAHHPGPMRVWRHPGLSFGAYVTSLPVGDPVEPPLS